MLVYVYIMSGGEHTVMIRVFDGGDGWTSGGRSERSSESGDVLPDDARERDGDGMVTCMFAVASMCVECRGSVCVSCCWCEWKSSAETIEVLYQACSGVGMFQLPHLLLHKHKSWRWVQVPQAFPDWWMAPPPWPALHMLLVPGLWSSLADSQHSVC